MSNTHSRAFESLNPKPFPGQAQKRPETASRCLHDFHRIASPALIPKSHSNLKMCSWALVTGTDRDEDKLRGIAVLTNCNPLPQLVMVRNWIS